MTSGGMVEATGAGFANTWKAQSSCHDKLDWLDDPCSLNIESGKAQGKLLAVHWLVKDTQSRQHSLRAEGAPDEDRMWGRGRWRSHGDQHFHLLFQLVYSGPMVTALQVTK